MYLGWSLQGNGFHLFTEFLISLSYADKREIPFHGSTSHLSCSPRPNCSSLNRSEETARIIAKDIPGVTIQPTDLLWECIPTMTPKLQVEMPNYTLTQVDQDRQRAEVAYRKYFKIAKRNDRHDVIVCHGNLIRYFITRILNAAPDSWMRMDLCNCGITQVLIQPDGDMALLCHNDWSHLPKEMRTSTLRSS